MFISWLSYNVFELLQAETEVSLLKQEKLRLQSQVKLCTYFLCFLYDVWSSGLF